MGVPELSSTIGLLAPAASVRELVILVRFGPGDVPATMGEDRGILRFLVIAPDYHAYS
jgi:hypothetical protein